MSAIDIFGLLVPVTYLLMLGIEALFPARQFPPIPYWRLKGFCFLTVQGLLATLTPLVIPEHWLAAHRLINLEGLGVIGGAVLGYAVVSLASYAWHRSAHTFSPMWRLFHQIHHSPQRVDMSGAALFHPLETVAFLADRRARDDAGARARSGRRRAHGLHRRLLRLLPAHEHPHAAMARLHHPAAGSPLHPSPARRARLQLRRPADLGHAVRHLPQSGGFRRRSRIRSARHQSSRRDADLRRCQRSRCRT